MKLCPHAPLARTVLAVSIALAASSASAQTATPADLAQRLDQLTAELASIKAQLGQMKQVQVQQAQNATAGAQVAAGSSGATPPAPDSAAVAGTGTAPYGGSLFGAGTVLTSYGELNYHRPTRRTENAQADLRRFVLGYQHRFDDKTKVVAELEVEHAVSSASDRGEVAIEQAYVERQLTPALALRAGLFLMPVGLLNENHEPTAFYGVERNFVETAIIPSTWREGGVQLVGNFDNGVTLQAGVTTGFDLNKWDAASAEGKASPLGSIHQELALAKARDLALFAALNWRGIPGLLVGGSMFSGLATHAQAVADARVTLWDLHARWTPGRWDFSTLYSRGVISNTAALNAALVGNPTLIPNSFDGFYTQAAYKLWSREDVVLSPFVRWEHFNTAKAYDDLGAGLTPDAGRAEQVVTVGANLRFAQGVVLKADYQRFRTNADLNRVNLGLGWSF